MNTADVTFLFVCDDYHEGEALPEQVRGLNLNTREIGMDVNGKYIFLVSTAQFNELPLESIIFELFNEHDIEIWEG